MVIHFRFPLDAITVLAALTHPGHLLM
jgi:hypothetical protein